MKKNLEGSNEPQIRKKTSLKLTDDQLKFLEEVPNRASQFISTFNHIGKSIETFYDEIRFIINRFIKEQKDWKINESESYDLLIIPFAYTPGSVESDSDQLQPGFSVTGRIIMIREISQNGINNDTERLELHWGFNFHWNNEPPDKHFFIELGNFNNPVGEVLTQSQYHQIANDIKLFLEIQEEDFYQTGYSNKDQFEYFTVRLNFKYLDKFSKFFELCKITLVKYFLDKMNHQITPN